MLDDEYDELLKPKPIRYDSLDELSSDDFFRFKLFKKNYPEIFRDIDSGSKEVSHYQAFNYLKMYYDDNDRSRYITLLRNIHYYLMPIDNETFSPEFMWEMMVKYNSVMSKVTNADRRKWKIQEILK
jgi:hypothetical protein